MRSAAVLMVMFALVWCPPATAHLLKVFAWAEGAEIRGYAYTAGGGRASGARITVLGPDGTTLATLPPDDAGEFRYVTKDQGPHRIVADSGDGHRASWTVGAAESGAAHGGAAAPPGADAGLPDDPQATATLSDDRLAALVERAVARQVGPLRAELQAHAARARLGDVVGGIGFIFGIAGVVLWWRSRRGGR